VMAALPRQKPPAGTRLLDRQQREGLSSEPSLRACGNPEKCQAVPGKARSARLTRRPHIRCWTRGALPRRRRPRPLPDVSWVPMVVRDSRPASLPDPDAFTRFTPQQW
jgi:hypothetical protein